MQCEVPSVQCEVPSVQCEGSEIVEVVVDKDVRKRSRENTIEEKRRMRNFRKKRKRMKSQVRVLEADRSGEGA